MLVKNFNYSKLDNAINLSIYCANYEYRNYSLDELKNAYEIVFNDEEKESIKNNLKDILLD